MCGDEVSFVVVGRDGDQVSFVVVGRNGDSGAVDAGSCCTGHDGGRTGGSDGLVARGREVVGGGGGGRGVAIV